MKIKRINTKCTYCGSDNGGLIRDKLYGDICPACLYEYEEIDRETDWDVHAEVQRMRLAEQNEY